MNFALSDHVIRSKEIMDRLRDAITGMIDEENRLLQNRTEESRASFNKVLTTLGITTAIAVGLVVLGYLLIRRDAAQRRRAAAEHNRLANYNHLLIESTGDGIYGVDLDGNCTFLNAAVRESWGGNPKTSWANQCMT